MNRSWRGFPRSGGGGGKRAEFRADQGLQVGKRGPVIRKIGLVARVQGFLTDIAYQDGAFVKKGQHLFTIEPEPYQLKLQQAQAAEQAAQATATQTQADFERQQELVQRQAAMMSYLDTFFLLAVMFIACLPLLFRRAADVERMLVPTTR